MNRFLLACLAAVCAPLYVMANLVWPAGLPQYVVVGETYTVMCPTVYNDGGWTETVACFPEGMSPQYADWVLLSQSQFFTTFKITRRGGGTFRLRVSRDNEKYGDVKVDIPVYENDPIKEQTDARTEAKLEVKIAGPGTILQNSTNEYIVALRDEAGREYSFESVYWSVGETNGSESAFTFVAPIISVNTQFVFSACCVSHGEEYRCVRKIPGWPYPAPGTEGSAESSGSGRGTTGSDESVSDVADSYLQSYEGISDISSDDEETVDAVIADEQGDILPCPEPKIYVRQLASENYGRFVSISNGMPEAEIYYTTDGSDPHCGFGKLYTKESVIVANNKIMVVRAYAKRVGYADSDTALGVVDPFGKCDLIAVDGPDAIAFSWPKGTNMAKYGLSCFAEDESAEKWHAETIDSNFVDLNVPSFGDKEKFTIHFYDYRGVQTSYRPFAHAYKPTWTSCTNVTAAANAVTTNVIVRAADGWLPSVKPQSATNWVRVAKLSDGELRISLNENTNERSRSAVVGVETPIVAENRFLLTSRKTANILLMQGRNDSIPATIFTNLNEVLHADFVLLRWQTVNPDDFNLAEPEDKLFYEVYRSLSAVGEKRFVGRTDETVFCDRTCLAGVPYYYWVRAVRGSQASRFCQGLYLRGLADGFVDEEKVVDSTGGRLGLSFAQTNAWSMWSESAWLKPVASEGAGSAGVAVDVDPLSGSTTRSGRVFASYEVNGATFVDEIVIRQQSDGMVSRLKVVGLDGLFVGDSCSYTCTLDCLGGSSVAASGVTYVLHDDYGVATLQVAGDTAQIVARKTKEMCSVVLEAKVSFSDRTMTARKIIRICPRIGIGEALGGEVGVISEENSGWIVAFDDERTDRYIVKRDLTTSASDALKAYVDRGVVSFRCKVPADFSAGEDRYVSVVIGSSTYRLTYADAPDWTEFKYAVETDNTLISIACHQSGAKGAVCLADLSWSALERVKLDVEGADSVGAGKSAEYSCSAWYVTQSGTVPLDGAGVTWSIVSGGAFATLTSTGEKCTLTARVCSEQQVVSLQASYVKSGATYRQCKQVVVCSGNTMTCEDALDVAGVTVTTGGDAGWFGQSVVSKNGGTACQSEPLSSGEESWIRMQVVTGGTLSFSWRLLGNSGDVLEFFLDGSYRVETTSAEWRDCEISIVPGRHVLTWRYRRYSPASVDASAWLDCVSWEPTHAADSETITGLRIDGGDEIFLGETASFKTVAVYADGHTQQVLPAWSLSGSLATLTRMGMRAILTAGEIEGDAVLNSRYSDGDTVFSATQTISVSARRVTGCTLSGAETLTVGKKDACRCTLTFEGDRTVDVAADISVVKGAEVVSISGLQVTGLAVGSATLRATYSYGNVTYSADAVCNVTAAPILPTGISISSVGRAETHGVLSCTCMVKYSDGSTKKVFPVWSVAAGAALAYIYDDGVLVTKDAPGSVTVKATYTESGETFTAYHAVQIVEQDLPDYGFPLSLSGASKWYAQSDIVRSSRVAMRSGKTESGQNSDLNARVTGPGRLTFWWRASTGYLPGLAGAFTGCRVELLVDGTFRSELHGVSSDWIKAVVNISNGTHVVTWRYADRSSALASFEGVRNCAWVADASYEAGTRFVEKVEIEGADSIGCDVTTGYVCKVSYSDGTVAEVTPEWSLGGALDGASAAADGTVTTGNDAGGLVLRADVNVNGEIVTAEKKITVVGEDLANVPWAVGTNGPKSGNEGWFVQSDEVHDGKVAFRSGMIVNRNYDSYLATTVHGPGRISFWWKVSSGSGNLLRFYRGGTPPS